MTQIFRRFIGKIIEWFLYYEHIVHIKLDENAKMPFHKYDGDAGHDLYAFERMGFPPYSTRDVRSGVYIDPKSRIWFEIKARSSTLKVKGLEVVDAVIDRSYRGEMLAVVHNPTGENKYIEAGERVVQIIPHHLIPVKFVEGELTDGGRGLSGFGSTGV